MSVRIVGIDCATEDAKIGLALGEEFGGRAVMTEVRICSAESRAATLIADWLRREPKTPTLLAIDAPLGWPKDLAESLIEHRAGASVSVQPNRMFRRETDRFVHAQLNKTPLEVGADRIARTAHAALVLLTDLRKQLDIKLPLAWGPDWEGTAAIEVYPAATLLARKMTASGYKKKKHHASERESLSLALSAHLQLPDSCPAIVQSADALDAAVCVLAGADFVRGHAHQPADRELAEKEGWIWFASTSALPNMAFHPTPDLGSFAPSARRG